MSRDRRTWIQALDLLERDLDDSTRLLAAGVAALHDQQVYAWRPPVVREPLPLDLVARARALVERQRCVLAQIERAKGSIRAELDRAPSPAPAQPMGLPAYVDLTA